LEKANTQEQNFGTMLSFYEIFLGSNSDLFVNTSIFFKVYSSKLIGSKPMRVFRNLGLANSCFACSNVPFLPKATAIDFIIVSTASMGLS